MRLAIIVGFTADRRKAKVLSGPAFLPLDEAVSIFKAAVAAKVAPDGFPLVQIWSGAQVVKHHRFKVSDVAPPDDSEPPAGDESGVDTPDEPQPTAASEPLPPDNPPAPPDDPKPKKK